MDFGLGLGPEMSTEMGVIEVEVIELVGLFNRSE